MEDSHINKKGYSEKHSKLLHRQIAFKEIYQKNRDKYPLLFRQYQVHHKDKNKLNNEVSNLQLVIKEEHELIHGINKPAQIMKLAIKIALIGLVLSLIVEFGIIVLFNILGLSAIFLIVYGLYLYFKRMKARRQT